MALSLGELVYGDLSESALTCHPEAAERPQHLLQTRKYEFLCSPQDDKCLKAELSIYYMPKAKIFLLDFERKFVIKDRGRSQGPEATGLAKVGKIALISRCSGSGRGTGNRLVEAGEATDSGNSGNRMSSS
jgi:hypothetical protein